MPLAVPRLVVSGFGGESGKTLVSLALLLAAGRGGLAVRAYKKGPDYIDAAWLAWASQSPARNLDTFLIGDAATRASFAATALPDALNLVEGNRGLYDGVDSRGAHSTAELAKLLHAPVILVVNATKVTRTAAALVLGCQRLDPQVRIAGVILNHIATARHERVLRESIESLCSIPVLGAFPRLPGAVLPGRHLGLVPPLEHPGAAGLTTLLADTCARCVDLPAVLAVARQAPPLATPAVPPPAAAPLAPNVRIGVVRDSAFTFYYPENLEALEAGAARIVPCSALDGAPLPPDLDALYIGGGFPETHAAALASNRAFLDSLERAARRGLPVFAECGGLMLLARSISWQGNRYPMAGVLPCDVEVCLGPPQGHGYVELRVDRPNPFFSPGQLLRGHEFHYSHIAPAPAEIGTVCEVTRGVGCGNRRDAIVVHNVWAAYTHMHALAAPEWAAGLLAAARRFAAARA